jgi:hypothetical protein
VAGLARIRNPTVAQALMIGLNAALRVRASVSIKLDQEGIIMLQPDNPGLDLTRILDDATSVSPVARDQAAGLVEDYVKEQALASLDAVLGAADRRERADPDAVRTANYASQLVGAEVDRFRRLDRHSV